MRSKRNRVPVHRLLNVSVARAFESAPSLVLVHLCTMSSNTASTLEDEIQEDLASRKEATLLPSLAVNDTPRVLPSTPTLLRPPVDPRSALKVRGEDGMSVGGDLYVRKDGKLVRRVKRRPSGASSVSSGFASFDSTDDFSSVASADVYVRADGKKVRRVKKKKGILDKGPLESGEQLRPEQILVDTTIAIPATSCQESDLDEPPQMVGETGSESDEKQAKAPPQIISILPEPDKSIHTEDEPGPVVHFHEIHSPQPVMNTVSDSETSPQYEDQSGAHSSTEKIDSNARHPFMNNKERSPITSPPTKIESAAESKPPQPQPLLNEESNPITSHDNEDKPGLALFFDEGDLSSAPSIMAGTSSISLYKTGPTRSFDTIGHISSQRLVITESDPYMSSINGDNPGLAMSISEPEPIVSFLPSTDDDESKQYTYRPSNREYESEPEPMVSFTSSEDTQRKIRPTLSAEEYLKIAYSVEPEGAHSFSSEQEPTREANPRPDSALLVTTLKAVDSMASTDRNVNPWLIDPSFSSDDVNLPLQTLNQIPQDKSKESSLTTISGFPPVHSSEAMKAQGIQKIESGILTPSPMLKVVTDVVEPILQDQQPQQDRDQATIVTNVAKSTLQSQQPQQARDQAMIVTDVAEPTLQTQQPQQDRDQGSMPASDMTVSSIHRDIVPAMLGVASSALESVDRQPKNFFVGKAPVSPLSQKSLSTVPQSSDAFDSSYSHDFSWTNEASRTRGYVPPQISTTLSGYSCTTDYSTTVATTDRTLDSWTDSPEVSPRRGLRVPEVLAARTRSRMADVSDSPNSHTKLYTAYDSRTGSPMRRINEDDDAYILSTTMSRKRVRVAQLLCFGLLGFSFGLLGSYFVQSSCHFVSAEVTVGESTFDLHYGMWKYSTLESSFQGFPFCTSYDTVYTYDAPLIPRICGVSAMILGSFSLANLWVYLILGQASRSAWLLAVVVSGLAGTCQGLTFLFFQGHVCQRNTCSFGPGASVSLVSTIVWFVLAFEMYYNTPLSAVEAHIPGSGNLVSSLDASDFGNATKAYCMRLLDKGDQGSLPTLNQIQRNNSAPFGEGVLELSTVRSPMHGGSYAPPGWLV